MTDNALAAAPMGEDVRELLREAVRCLENWHECHELQPDSDMELIERIRAALKEVQK